jgi:hypothetical protein
MKKKGELIMRKLNIRKGSQRKQGASLADLSGDAYHLPAVGTLEIVIIIAVLLSIALLFRSQISAFAHTLFDKVFNTSFIGDL